MMAINVRKKLKFNCKAQRRKRLSQLETALFAFSLQVMIHRPVHRDHSSAISRCILRHRPPPGGLWCAVVAAASASAMGRWETASCRSLTWATTPAKSSSTRWSRNADTSMNLQPRLPASRIPSNTMHWNNTTTLTTRPIAGCCHLANFTASPKSHLFCKFQ